MPWTAASAPCGMPWPNWLGPRNSAIASMTLFPAHLATRRRRVQPTAIGRTPPSFFSRAIKEAPKNKGRTLGGALPARIRLVKDVSALSS